MHEESRVRFTQDLAIAKSHAVKEWYRGHSVAPSVSRSPYGCTLMTPFSQEGLPYVDGGVTA